MFLFTTFFLFSVLLNGVLAAPARGHRALVKRRNSSIIQPTTNITTIPSIPSVTVTSSGNVSLSTIIPSSSPASHHSVSLTSTHTLSLSSLLPSPSSNNIHSVAPAPIAITSPLHVGSLFDALFPQGITRNAFWSTAAGVIHNPKPLTLESFNVVSTTDIAAPRFALAPDGSPSVEAKIAKGTYDYHNGPSGQVGLNLYANPLDTELANAKEVTFGYSVMFSENYDAVKGGKLPGIYGGNSASEALHCSGGRRDPGCYSVRFMWREEMKGEAYTYLPSGSHYPENKQICDVPPYSTCNDKFGASIARGSWTFQPGKWQTLAQRVKLNDFGQKNGEMEVLVGGVSMFDLKGLTFVTTPEGRFHGIMAQVFPGGHDPSWAPSKDQSVFFKDFSLVVTQTY